ncbi:MAG TPA: hypothetical protein GXZ86_08835 [Clostridiales bacterium]|nr:hypothetical protein [Clostridiales bacterium]
MSGLYVNLKSPAMGSRPIRLMRSRVYSFLLMPADSLASQRRLFMPVSCGRKPGLPYLSFNK